MKVSFDFDGTLNTKKGVELAKMEIANGNTIYIISARSNKSSMILLATRLSIPSTRVFATGSNKEKVNKVNSLGIERHYDNNPDVINALGNKGKLV